MALRQNPFLIDEVIVSDSRLALKLFEKEPFDIIDFAVKGNRFLGYGYRNRNFLLREVFMGNKNGNFLNVKPLKGVNEIYSDCQNEIYAISKDSAYIFNIESDLIEISPICSSEFFYEKVKPIKALGSDHFIYMQKSQNGQYHDYFIGNFQDDERELLYRVGEWRNENKVKKLDKQRKDLELSKIKKAFISGTGIRIINSQIQQYLYSVFIDYPPVNSNIVQAGDSVFLFDYNYKEIHCFRTNGQLLWSSEINMDLKKDFKGNVHMDKVSGRFFLEFLNVQSTYLIEIDPVSGNRLKTIPILKYKHIDHLHIDNSRLYFLHQPDFGDRGKKIYILDI